MNQENLHILINRYEENYYMINNKEHYELFKWIAVRKFQHVWFSEEAKSMSFAKKFALATKESSIMVNNSRISPTNGIVKMAEERPEEVEALFTNLLFVPYDSIDQLQKQMDTFLTKVEEIRQELFPRFFRYKQDRHAVSCYLTFLKPEEHFVYRFSDAEAFAIHVEYGMDLGSGASFNLANYYDMAGQVVEALKEHPTLIEKYEALIKDNDKFYYDESLHLMAFDLMYCCRCYHFYGDMKFRKKKESIKAHSEKQLIEKQEAERQEKMDAIRESIREIELELAEYEEVSLLGVEVRQMKFGKGLVVAQSGSKVKVQFGEKAVDYVINKKFPMRPRFENDEEIVQMFSEYDELVEKKRKLEREYAHIC